MRDERSPLLRELLLAGAGSTPALDLRYDDELVEAVRGFQLQHGLEADVSSAPPPWRRSMSARPAASISCASTSSACAGSAATSSRNRCWWTSPGTADLFPRQLSVLADAHPGRPRGAADTAAEIADITPHPEPHLTVPPTILARQAAADSRGHRLPGAPPDARDRRPGQFRGPLRRGLANPRGILLRQDAGPANPLGQVAIRFANPFSVYLHDTPSKPLFERAARAVSSGCVRVESALQLVDLLLEEDERNTVARLLQSGETHEYRLARQTPILMAY